MYRILIAVTISMAFLGTAVASDQCADCHDDRIKEMRAKKSVHPALEDDACGDCHEFHGDNEKLILVEEGNALCLQCHDDPAEGRVVHEAVSDGSCTDCHDPHSSGQDALLIEETAKLCSQCHDVPDEMSNMTHSALSDGECTDCHDPHSAEFSRLLIDKYETTRFPGGFTEEMYTLCFQCHESSLVTGGAEETNFRNGSKNLHNVHVMGALKPNKYGIVKRGRARSCSICHNAHGSTQPYSLIRKYEHKGITFLTMTYTSSEDGGNCTVGCHKPQGYTRSSSDSGQGS